MYKTSKHNRSTTKRALALAVIAVCLVRESRALGKESLQCNFDFAKNNTEKFELVDHWRTLAFDQVSEIEALGKNDTIELLVTGGESFAFINQSFGTLGGLKIEFEYRLPLAKSFRISVFPDETRFSNRDQEISPFLTLTIAPCQILQEQPLCPDMLAELSVMPTELQSSFSQYRAGISNPLRSLGFHRVEIEYRPPTPSSMSKMGSIHVYHDGSLLHSADVSPLSERTFKAGFIGFQSISPAQMRPHRQSKNEEGSAANMKRVLDNYLQVREVIISLPSRYLPSTQRIDWEREREVVVNETVPVEWEMAFFDECGFQARFSAENEIPVVGLLVESSTLFENIYSNPVDMYRPTILFTDIVIARDGNAVVRFESVVPGVFDLYLCVGSHCDPSIHMQRDEQGIYRASISFPEAKNDTSNFVSKREQALNAHYPPPELAFTPPTDNPGDHPGPSQAALKDGAHFEVVLLVAVLCSVPVISIGTVAIYKKIVEPQPERMKDNKAFVASKRNVDPYDGGQPDFGNSDTTTGDNFKPSTLVGMARDFIGSKFGRRRASSEGNASFGFVVSRPPAESSDTFPEDDNTL